MPLTELGGVASQWQFRVGRMGSTPVAAIVSAQRAVVVDAERGSVLTEVPATDGEVILDVAIETDGVWLLRRDADGVAVSRLLGAGRPSGTAAVKGASSDAEFPGALRVVGGAVHIVTQGEDADVYIPPDGQPEPCLPAWSESVGYAENLDLHVLPAVPGGKPRILTGFGCDAPSSVGGHLMGRSDWFGDRQQVIDGQVDHDTASGSYPDIWTGLIGDRWVIATGADTSIQIRDLLDGQLISVRMTGAGQILRDPNVVSSVGICGDLVAVVLDDRMEVRRWDDFSTIQIVPNEQLPWQELVPTVRVRLVESSGQVWLIASDGKVLWSEAVRFPRLLATAPSPIPREWRRLSVASDGALIAGIGPKGVVHAIGDARSGPTEPLAESESQAPWQVAQGPCTDVFVGVIDGSHEVFLVADEWTAAGPANGDEGRLMQGKRPQDEDYIVIALPEHSIVARRSGAVTLAGGGVEDAFEWQEKDEIFHMRAPHPWAGRGDLADHLAVIGVNRVSSGYGIVALRDPLMMGQQLGEAVLGWIADLDTASIGEELLICVVTATPGTLTTLRWARGINLEKVVEVSGIKSHSVALATSAEGVVAAYVAEGVCHLVDPMSGAPLGDALAFGDSYGVVEGPYGTRFLLGAEVHALPPHGHELPWIGKPFPRGDLRAGDVGAPWLGSWQTRKAHKEARERAAAAKKAAAPSLAATTAPVKKASTPPGQNRPSETAGASPTRAGATPRVDTPRPGLGPSGIVMDLAEYVTWEGSGLKALALATDEEISAALVQIVSVEGPMLAGHAYMRYLLGAGERPALSTPVKKRLNPLVTPLTRQGRLAMIKDGTTGVIGKTLYMPGTPPVVVRELSGRLPELVPASEVLALLERTGVAPTDPEAVEAVLKAWPKPDASENARAYLRWCLGYTWVRPGEKQTR